MELWSQGHKYTSTKGTDEGGLGMGGGCVVHFIIMYLYMLQK